MVKILMMLMLFVRVCLQRGLLLVLFGDEVAPTESLILTLILTFIFGKGGGGVLLPKQSPGLLALK